MKKNSTISDQNIRNFIHHSKVELTDQDFTERLGKKLPVRKHYDWVIVLFAFIGSAIAGIIGLNSQIYETSWIVPTLEGTQLWIFLGFIFLFPFVALIQVLRKS